MMMWSLCGVSTLKPRFKGGHVKMLFRTNHFTIPNGVKTKWCPILHVQQSVSRNFRNIELYCLIIFFFFQALNEKPHQKVRMWTQCWERYQRSRILQENHVGQDRAARGSAPLQTQNCKYQHPSSSILSPVWIVSPTLSFPWSLSP